MGEEKNRWDELVGKFSEEKPDWTRTKTGAQKKGFVSLKKTIGVLSNEQMRLLRENVKFAKKYGYRSKKLEAILPMISLRHGPGRSFAARRQRGVQKKIQKQKSPRDLKRAQKSKQKRSQK